MQSQRLGDYGRRKRDRFGTITPIECHYSVFHITRPICKAAIALPLSVSNTTFG